MDKEIAVMELLMTLIIAAGDISVMELVQEARVRSKPETAKMFTNIMEDNPGIGKLRLSELWIRVSIGEVKL